MNILKCLYFIEKKCFISMMQRDGFRKSENLIYLSVYDKNQTSKDFISDIFDSKVIFKFLCHFLHIDRKKIACMDLNFA